MAARVVPIPAIPTEDRLQTRPARVYRFPPRTLNSTMIEACTPSQLRRKLRKNQISFPAQVPTFAKHDRPDVQRKAAQLYFLFGWSCLRIAQRYGLLRQRVQQILTTWMRRAIQAGYIQEIPPENPPGPFPRSGE